MAKALKYPPRNETIKTNYLPTLAPPHGWGGFDRERQVNRRSPETAEQYEWHIRRGRVEGQKLRIYIIRTAIPGEGSTWVEILES